LGSPVSNGGIRGEKESQIRTVARRTVFEFRGASLKSILPHLVEPRKGNSKRGLKKKLVRRWVRKIEREKGRQGEYQLERKTGREGNKRQTGTRRKSSCAKKGAEELTLLAEEKVRWKHMEGERGQEKSSNLVVRAEG